MALDAQGTVLAISTGAAGEAITITDITLANPTILTATAHGLRNGDVVAAADFAGEDAASINGNSYVVSYVTDDTFAIDLDSTDLTIDDNTESATMTPDTWTDVGVITNFSISPSRSERDKTTLVDTERTYKVGLSDEGPWTFNVMYDNDDAGLSAVKTAYEDGAEDLGFRITFSDDEAVTLEDGYVLNYSIDGEVDGLASGTITVRGTRAA
jgi:hypothetical protein